MEDIKIDGVCSRVKALGEDDYILIKLTAPNLKTLSAILRRTALDSKPTQVLLGRSRITFYQNSEHFSIELAADDEIIINVKQTDFDDLIRNIDALITAELAEDYIVHLHLDTYFDKKGIGVSDVVIQRIDAYNP